MHRGPKLLWRLGIPLSRRHGETTIHQENIYTSEGSWFIPISEAVKMAIHDIERDSYTRRHSHYQMQKEKKECYPPENSDSSAKITLQSLLDITAKRILIFT